MIKDIGQIVDFLDSIYGNQPNGFVCLSTKDRERDRWRDRFFENADHAISWVESEADSIVQTHDLYFCPTTLSEARRKKEFVLPSRYLWSDLDFADPHSFSKEWRPDIVWESSPGRWQCLWTLDKLYEPSSVESKNKGMAHMLDADLGGWDLTQVLRIPGSINHKYPEQPMVQLLWEEEGVHPLKHFPEFKEEKVDTPPEEDYESARISIRAAIRKYGKQLPRKARNTLLARRAEEGRRSDILWYLAHELAKAGFPRSVSLTVLRSCVWNKYKNRSDEEERLRHELSIAYSSVRESNTRDREREVEDEETPGRLGKAISLTRFYTRDIAEQRWLVDKMWTDKGHGIVGGEPKSYKSQAVLDMSWAVATGDPFLGQFEVPEPGPVIIVQNENSAWDMRNRFSDISNEYDHNGSVGKITDGMLRMRLPKEVPIYLQDLPTGFYMDEPEYLDELGKRVRDIQPKLVIFDPFMNMYSGDFNNAQEIRPVLNALFLFKKKFDTAVLVVHHKHKNSKGQRGGQGMLGSMALHAWVESAWYIDTVQEKEDGEEDGLTSKPFSEITLEREIRGSVPYPRLNLRVYNDPYRIKVMGSKVQYQIRESILQRLSTGPLTSSELRKVLEKDRKPVMIALRALRDEKIVRKRGDIYSLRKKSRISDNEEVIEDEIT